MATDAPSGVEPLHLVEDEETSDKFVLFTTSTGVELQLRFDGDEPWATRKQMAELFGVTIRNIELHVKKILDDDELVDPESSTKESFVGGVDGRAYPVRIFNLDVILEVGHRVNSKQGILFRRWARAIERRYLISGFVIDKPRLVDPNRNDHLDELLREIAEIRASEANVWKRVLELVSKCSDYHAMSDDDRGNYFAMFQNTVHWAVTTSDAANIIGERASAANDHAGLTNFNGLKEGKLPHSDDMTVAKNYYGQDEIKRLIMITNLALDFLASQAEQGRLVTVLQYTQKLRELVKLDGRPLRPIKFFGNITKAAADKKAKHELAIYKERVRIERESDGERKLASILVDARKAVSDKLAAKPNPKPRGKK